MPHAQEQLIRFTAPKLPVTERDSACLPLGVAVQPFAPLSASAPASQDSSQLDADSLPRCGDCAAYICGFCQLEREGWVCALCGRFTKFDRPVRDRYRRSTRRVDVPELAAPVYECLVASQLVPWQGAPLSTRPVYVAVVDTCTDSARLDTVRTALHAALLAAGPHALFGLLTVAGRVTMWDVRGSPPVASHVHVGPLHTRGPASAPPGHVCVPLSDVMPLEAFLADVSTCRDSIECAFDMLRPATQAEQASSDDGDAPPDGEDARAFGPAVDAVLTYFGAAGAEASPSAQPPADRPPQFPFVRVLCFLGGPPSVGVGAVDTSRWGDAQARVFPSAVVIPHIDTPSLFGGPHAVLDAAAAAADQLAVPSTDFYTAAAGRAAGAGIVVDVFALPALHTPTGLPAYVDLASIAPLARATGGRVALYPAALPVVGLKTSAGAHPLTRDVHRAVSGPCALHATLRLRCSPELRPAHAYGCFVEHSATGVARGEEVHLLGACGPWDAVVFDLEFLSTQGLHAPSPVEQPPAVQVAFEYTVIVPLEAEPQPEAGSDGVAVQPAARQGPCFVRQRRRRIMTAPAQVARSGRAMYESCDMASIACVLIHKALHATAVRGVSDARRMLVDWMALVASTCSSTFAAPGSQAAPDPTCAACPSLHAMPRVVFGVLASPLLWPLRTHPDVRAVAAAAATSLTPEHCVLWAYPKMTAWADVDTPLQQEEGGHEVGIPLSRSAMASAGASIFVIDALHTVVVYSAAVPPGQEQQPVPAPLGTLLRARVNGLKDSRGVTPRLLSIRGGIDDVAALETALLDEGSVCAVDGDASLAAFMQAVVGVATHE